MKSHLKNANLPLIYGIFDNVLVVLCFQNVVGVLHKILLLLFFFKKRSRVRVKTRLAVKAEPTVQFCTLFEHKKLVEHGIKRPCDGARQQFGEHFIDPDDAE